jgi:hypothetical protein
MSATGVAKIVIGEFEKSSRALPSRAMAHPTRFERVASTFGG